MSPSTRLNYERSWKSCTSFLSSLNIDPSLPVKEETIALYVTHLWKCDLKPSTIRSTLSAVSFYLKINLLPVPCNSYLVRQTLKGAEKNTTRRKPRLRPIQKDLLYSMIAIIPILFPDPYERILYQALLITAYFCCLRAGEAVISNSSSHTLLREQITLEISPYDHYLIQFRSFKHCDHSNEKFILKKSNDSFCPVNLLNNYLHVRPSVPGPLFVLFSGKPLNRSIYSKLIKSCIKKLGHDNSLYNTHSIRIGRATDLAIDGAQPDVIKRIGRWSSSAYLKYIRLEHFILPTS